MHRLLLLGMLLLAPAAAFGQASQVVASERAEARLVAEDAAVVPGRAFRVGLHLAPALGWHTYFRNPGDAGAPTTVELALPQGASAGGIAWPAPVAIPEGPLVVFGYRAPVLLPITVTPPAALAPGGTFRIEAQAAWLVCEKICVPEEGSFTLELLVLAEGAAEPPPPPARALFAETDLLLPRAAPFAATAGFQGREGALRLEGPALGPATVRQAFFFPDREGVLDNAAGQRLDVAPGVVTLRLAPGPTATGLSRLDGTLVLADAQGGRAAFAIAAPLGALPVAPEAQGAGLAQALLLALLGGLVLDLMPCVFPILAIKAFTLARLGGAELRTVRAEAASYTLGVVLSFLALGGLLLLLRQGGGALGAAAGWGFQFTQPVFVAAMAWLMLAVGLNLSGVYAVGRPVGAGQALAGRGGHLGSFMTGVLAVLVATPCTAPFMAAALAAALVMPPAQALGVFAALGAGLALPTVVLALAPRLARALPRPGAWMEVARQALAFPMYAAAAWLVWVLAQQGGAQAVLLALAGGLLVALAAWLAGLLQHRGSWQLAFALPLLAALALLPRIAALDGPTATAAEAPQAWSAERVAALQASGRKVFVNVTAAWCLTCKVNEQVALQRDAVQAAFRAGDVAYLAADWTRADPAITALLRAERRDGVPLYLLYPAGGGPPRVLPQLLSEAIVLEALSGG